jgi:glycosyltransferase involved in cell wall biosynthesis
VELLEPPVDLELDDPALAYPNVRTELGATDEVLVVVIGRLAAELKLEGLLSAVEAVRQLGARTSLRLVIVGDGPARDEVTVAAAAANRDVGRTVVDVIGSRSDPRPWYAGADIALGMGGSALRAMAFGKPLVVQGERGYWQLLTPDTLPEFERQGWYGVGDGRSGAESLVPLLRELAAHQELRFEMGGFARSVVESRFDLVCAGDLLERIYEESAESRTSRGEALGLLVGPLAQVLAYEFSRRIHRALGRGATDDVNAIARQPGATTGRGHA